MLAVVGLFIALLGFVSSTYMPLAKRQELATFDWASIQPSLDLRYHDCFDGMKCARLQVPLDWTRANTSVARNDSVAIAIVTLPATVPNDHPNFGGTVLVNPGGPGGSGTEVILQLGRSIQRMLEGDKHYEILGFDPRGVGETTPAANCFKDEYTRAAYTWQQRPMSPVQQNGGAFDFYYSSYKAYSSLCEANNPGDIFRHLTTASVARDMLEIVDRVDQVRRGGSVTSKTELPRLQYIGFSYGTYLGNTFASMYPGRVGRLLLDGVVDPEDYARGQWLKTINDVEKVIDYFYQQCFDSNSCPLKLPNESGPADLKGRVDEILRQLDEASIAVIHRDQIVHVTSTDLRKAILATMDFPITYFPVIGQILADVIAGDYSLLLDTIVGLPSKDASCAAEPTGYSWNADASYAIACSDAFAPAGERNVTFYKNIVDTLVEQSPTTAAPWAALPLTCIGRTLEPPSLFQGPFTSPAPANDTNSPSAPLLILSTRLDPVTSLQNAYTVQKQHPGSAVVIQETAGHCALLSSKSDCIDSIVRNYFDSGVVPEPGTSCQPDCEAFGEGCQGPVRKGKRGLDGPWSRYSP